MSFPRQVAAPHGETRQERVNRELIELLNELRVVIPGVQVLFAFLLTVPFTTAFGHVSQFDRALYFVAFSCVTVATALLVAPSAYHRLHFRKHDKEELLFTANRLAIAGIAFVALAMTAVVLLVTSRLFGWPAGLIATGLAGALFAWFWYGLPASRLRRLPRRREDL